MIQVLVLVFELNCRMSLPIDVFPALAGLCTRAGQLAALLACLALAGCTALGAPHPDTVPQAMPQPQAVITEPPPVQQVSAEPVPTAAASVTPSAAADLANTTAAAARRLLAFNERIRELGPADLARESVRLGDATDPATTLELALVLAQTRQTGDLARALTLVEPLARASSNGKGNAAYPWQGLARLLHLRLLEQRRLEEQAERLNLQTRDMQRRIDQLSSQIDALRAIERSLNTRPAGTPPPAPASPPR